jgi:oligosaccharide repeat unit polymerase
MACFKVKSTLRNTVLFGLALTAIAAAGIPAVAGAGSFETACDMMFFANILLNIAIITDLLCNIRRDFPLLMFVCSFDVLLLGRVYVSFLGHHSDLLYYLEADNYGNLYKALQVVTISLLAVYAAYKLAAPFFSKREHLLKSDGLRAFPQKDYVPVIRQLSVIVLLVSSLAYFYILLAAIMNVLKNGYLGSFTQKAQSIPTVISRLSMFFPPSFAVFLATMPDKKQMRFPFAVYIIYMFVSLLTGRRNTFVCEAFMIIIYFVLRDNLLEKDRRVFKKRSVVLALVLLIPVVYLLQIFAEVRTGFFDPKKSFGYIMMNFFNSQGATFRVVIQTVNRWDFFNHNVSYKFLYYPFELFVHNNVVTRNLFGLSPIIEVQTPLFARTTHNFAHALTYMVDRSRYIAGGGFGTSFVAEAYVAYGMPGVVAVSALIGVIFRFFSSMLSRSWVVVAISLLAVKDLVYIPRSFAFLWVTDVFNITYLCFFMALYIVALFTVKRGTHVRRVNGTGKETAVSGEAP